MLETNKIAAVNFGLLVVFIFIAGCTQLTKENAKITTVSGYVISGGDTTPEGLFDVPRVFVYEIRKDDGSVVNVAYTAYPPSPVGNNEMKKIRLKGPISIGVYLIAHGTYNKETNTLIVANDGDYIETYPKKP